MSPIGGRFVIDAFPDAAFRHRDRDALACIDVLLSTTTLVTAAADGRRTFVAGGPGEIHELGHGLGDMLLAGGREAGTPFEIADGPCALPSRAADDRPLLLFSPPGTELIAHAADGHARTFLACFRNLTATADALAGFRRVALLIAGHREEMSCEDQMAAAWIAERLAARGFAPEDRRTADMMRRWRGIDAGLVDWGNSAAELRRVRRAEEIAFVVGHVDDVHEPFVCTGREVHRAGAWTETETLQEASLVR